MKDPSVVFFNNQWHVYATDADTAGNFNMLYLNFTDWSQAAAATPYYMDQTPGFTGYHAAPQIFYFTPQKKWYLIYQSGPPQYSTADDLSQPSTWTPPASFFTTEPAIITTNGGSIGWIDFWVICDGTNCFLFNSDDNGHWYRSQTTEADFPNGFGNTVIAMQDANKNNLFEASMVYKLKGMNEYLAAVEAIGPNGRYFRSWTAPALDGTWTALADTVASPFAGQSDVTFSGTAWTNSISHGELIRDGYDETLAVDPCHIQFLYQGLSSPASAGVTYNLQPWELGLLTQTN